MEALRKEPDVIEDEEHENFVVKDELATNTVNLKIFFWIDTTDFRQAALVTRSEVIRSVKEALEQNYYYLPADIQELKLYGAEKDFSIKMVKDED
ncbi:MAG: mechanosensitive ion channel family protein, partial [Spirosomataceae bacterium]